jgi:hypothetical protein
MTTPAEARVLAGLKRFWDITLDPKRIERQQKILADMKKLAASSTSAVSHEGSE